MPSRFAEANCDSNQSMNARRLAMPVRGSRFASVSSSSFCRRISSCDFSSSVIAFSRAAVFCSSSVTSSKVAMAPLGFPQPSSTGETFTAKIRFLPGSSSKQREVWVEVRDSRMASHHGNSGSEAPGS